MKPEGSSPISQEHSTRPYPDLDQFSRRPKPFLELDFNIILPSTPRSSKSFLSLGFP